MSNPTLFVSVGGGDSLACPILHCLSVTVVHEVFLLKRVGDGHGWRYDVL